MLDAVVSEHARPHRHRCLRRAATQILELDYHQHTIEHIAGSVLTPLGPSRNACLCPTKADRCHSHSGWKRFCCPSSVLVRNSLEPPPLPVLQTTSDRFHLWHLSKHHQGSLPLFPNAHQSRATIVTSLVHWTRWTHRFLQFLGLLRPSCFSFSSSLPSPWSWGSWALPWPSRLHPLSYLSSLSFLLSFPYHLSHLSHLSHLADLADLSHLADLSLVSPGSPSPFAPCPWRPLRPGSPPGSPRPARPPHWRCWHRRSPAACARGRSGGPWQGSPSEPRRRIHRPASAAGRPTFPWPCPDFCPSKSSQHGPNATPRCGKKDPQSHQAPPAALQWRNHISSSVHWALQRAHRLLQPLSWANIWSPPFAAHRACGYP
mmetsp:Transcript_42924/g.67988  ORF Transcript_42924/g.67988 Transcript_42924/m.67988 type:complete len:374 (-) Transcript_42924:178-1299(-)